MPNFRQYYSTAGYEQQTGSDLAEKLAVSVNEIRKEGCWNAKELFMIMPDHGHNF